MGSIDSRADGVSGQDMMAGASSCFGSLVWPLAEDLSGSEVGTGLQFAVRVTLGSLFHKRFVAWRWPKGTEGRIRHPPPLGLSADSR